MSRVQKKCLIGSAGFHLLLLVILLVGPALMSRDKPDDLPVLTMVNLPASVRVTDKETQTGGSTTPQMPAPTPPAPVTPPTPPAPPTPAVEPPTPKPPEPKPSFIEKLFTPEPPKPVKDPIDVTDDKPVKVKPQDQDGPPKKTKPAIEVAQKKVKLTASSSKSTSAADEAKAAAKEAAAEAAAAQRARRAAISHAVAGLENGLSSSAVVSIPGQGAATFQNYGEYVRDKYTAAWIPPADVEDDNSTVKVTVVIAHDGTVVSADVKTPSGNASVDRSVEQTLRRVKFIKEFPEGATDEQRTFIINFNLKAKRLNG